MDQPTAKSRDSMEGAGEDAPTQAPGNLDATLPVTAGTPPPPTPQQAPGAPATFLGPYELIEMLGRGGMGTVWKARHTKLDKLVALKVLPAHLMSDADAVSRFEREMKAVGKLEHAHIVRAMDAGQADGIHYLVMEYIEGVDLARLVKHRGPRKVNEACQMIRHAALGLAHAHEHGLVHRDIKPSNLLLSKRGFVKVLDLGLARLQGEKAAGEASLTVHGEMMGTPDYMAPEQWQSAHSVGPAADLYALGCTLYFLLAGHAPFAAADQSTYTQKMTAHLLQPPPALPDAPPELQTLYEKLMAKAPEQRPALAKVVADELRSMIRNWTASPAPVETILWQPVGSRESGDAGRESGVGSHGSGVRGEMLAASRRSWAAGVAVAAVAAAVGLATWSALSHKPRRSDELPSQTVGGNEAGNSVPVRSAPPLAIAPFDAQQARKHQEAWANYLGVPAEYENAIGMKFMLIPPGEYTRGTPADRIAALQENFKKSVEGKLPAEDQARGLTAIASESPAHRVRISQPFYLAAYEVTQQEFERIMGQNRSFFGPSGGGFDGKGPRARALPAENMSYDEAIEFCRRLGQSDSVVSPAGYRLPTDAEWEYACRAGTDGPFWFGSPLEDHTPYARWGEGSPLPVVPAKPELRRKPNPFGLCDMHGNVCELCQDFFAADDFAHFTSGIVDSPTGPASGSMRVMRGGGYASVGVMCRSASRGVFPSPQRNVGFRPVLAVAAVQKKVPPNAAARPSLLAPSGNGAANSAPSRPTPPVAVAPYDSEQARQHQQAWARYLGVPVEYVNSLGMRFCLIPPGEYQRGTLPERIEPLIEYLHKWQNEKNVPANFHTGNELGIRSEAPQHAVRITQPFYLSAREVTQSQFTQVMNRNPSSYGPQGKLRAKVSDQERPDLPINNVSFDDATEFCRALSAREDFPNGNGGGAYRLPSEAEWEHACRAGTITPFWFGLPGQDLTDLARCDQGTPQRVGKVKPNPFGLYDMHGNVWELCQDYFALDEYARYAGQTVESPTGPTSGTDRAARGGSFSTGSVLCRSATRTGISRPSPFFGFRPALNVESVRGKSPLSGAVGGSAQRLASDAASPDPKELFRVGRKLCFLEDDWQRGIPLLAKCDLGGIRNAAAAEMIAAASPQQQAEIGNLWYDAAAGAPDPDNWHCYRRARYWLTKALDEEKAAEKEAWYEAAKRQLALVPMLRAALRIRTSSFNNETIIIGRNQIEWISRDGQGPNVLSDANSTREFVSFKSKYGVQERHAFDVTNARWLLPEAVDFSTARLRITRKGGKTGPYVKAMIDKTRSDQSKVFVRIAEWDNQRNKGASYYGLFEVEALLSFGAPE